jgi:kumamolisin
MNRSREGRNVIRRFVIASSLALVWTIASASSVNAAPALFGPVPLTLMLRLQHEAQLDALVVEQATPGSMEYHRFLTSEQFRNYFSPTVTEYASTIAALRRQGFTIARVNANRTSISVNASPSVVEAALGVKLLPVEESGRLHYYTATPLRSPKALPFVRTIVGLDKTDAIYPAPRAAKNNGSRIPDLKQVAPDGGFPPAALTTGYDFPVTHGFDGSGVRVADVTDGPVVDGEVNSFLRYFGIKRTGPPTKRIDVKAACGGYEDDTFAPEFDAEWILSSAPGASFTSYNLLPAGTCAIIEALTKIDTANDEDVVNLSLASSEAWYPTIGLALSPLIEQGAAEGISFESIEFQGYRFGNAGGNGGKPYPNPFPLEPADSPYGLAIGVSNVFENASFHVEIQTGSELSGGGISVLFPAPVAQAKIAGVVSSGRNASDFALPGTVNGNGPSAYTATWSGGAPVSNNAPAAGLLATLVQMKKSRLGAFDVTLYSLFNKEGYGSVFSDINLGCSGTTGKPICAKKGYDLVTGIGSFDGYLLGKLIQ